MGRITNIVNTSRSVNNRYTYDLLGRLIREDNKEVGTTTLFEYDTNGNMLKKSVTDYSTSDTFTVKSEPSFTVSSDYADYIESYDGKAIETSSIGNITKVETTTYSWTKQIIEWQNADGNWGDFHSLAVTSDSHITSEQALRRLEKSGYTIEDECIQKQ